MPRPRTFDTNAVLATVVDLFWSHGFDGVSIQDIATATGLRPGSLHAVFGNKDALFALAFERYGERFHACMAVEDGGLAGAAVYLDRLVTAAVADPARRGCLIVNTASELHAHPEDIRTRVRERLDTIKAFFRARLAEDGIHDETGANALLGAAVSVLALARAGEDEGVLRDVATAALSHARTL